MKNACSSFCLLTTDFLRRVTCGLALGFTVLAACALPAWARESERPAEPHVRLAQVESPVEEGVPAPDEPAIVQGMELGESGLPVEDVLPQQPAEMTPAPPPPTRPVPLRPSTRPRPSTPRSLPSSTSGTPSPPGGLPITTPGDGEGTPATVTFNYRDADLLQVIEAVGEYTGTNFDVDPGVQGQKVTIIMNKPIPPELAYEVLESILASRNFDMAPSVDGQLVKILPKGQGTEKRPLVIGKSSEPEGFDRQATHVVAVEYAPVAELQQILQELGSQTATVSAYAPTNTLILTDTAEGIRRMLDFLKQVDIPGYETKQEIFLLQFSSADVIAQQIQEVLLGGQQGQVGVPQPGQAAPRPTTPARQIRPTVPGAQRQGQVVGAREDVLRIVPDERLNALIVVASSGLMEQVRDLINKLDTPTPTEFGNMRVYQLQNAKAEDMVTMLNSLVGAAPPASSGGGGGGGAGGPGGGAPSGGGRVPAATVQAFEKEVSVTQYEQTNSLLIVASPQDYKRLAEIIAQLDIPQRQVHVQATIMSVQINNNLSLAVETAGLTANDAFALNNVVSLANLLAEGPLAVAGEGTAIGVLDGTTQVTLTPGSPPVEIPNVPLLLTALENVTNLDVLSQPSLTTVDNQEARFVDGLNLPFITGSSRSLDQSTVNASVFQRVERQDVGVKLSVTPQISEGDNVFLELTIEVSQPVQSSVGQNADTVGPTIQKSEVENKVVVKDGGVGVIGGLISESMDRAVRQPPVLGDIPILGFLFRRSDHQRAKRNLVVLVTPNVVKKLTDLDRVTDFKLAEYTRSNADVVFERGFIKKIEKKQDIRRNKQPSAERTRDIQQGYGFKRGEITR